MADERWVPPPGKCCGSAGGKGCRELGAVARLTRKSNVVLIGFMGTGKTSVGQALALKLAWEFVDTDDEVERAVGLGIPEIFARCGETRFRQEESLAVRRVAARRRSVIATGGGVPLNAGNMAVLKTSGVTIRLTASPRVIYERVSRTRGSRPLLQEPDPLAAIERLLAEREPYYRQADFTVDTGCVALEQVLTTIVGYAENLLLP